MSRRVLCLVISLGQVMLAIALWWYAPLQVVAAQKAVHARYPGQEIQLGQEFYLRMTPAPAERFSLALNFPAAVLAGPFSFAFRKPLYESDLRFLAPKDLAFFFWTGVLWFWIASVVVPGKDSGDGQRKMPRWVRIAASSCGLAFALVVGAIALEPLLKGLSSVPYRQIAPYGMIWSAALGAYFIWRLISELRPTGYS